MKRLKYRLIFCYAATVATSFWNNVQAEPQGILQEHDLRRDTNTRLSNDASDANKIFAQQQSGEYAESLKNLDIAIRKQPGCEAYRWRARLHCKLKQGNLADEDFINSWRFPASQPGIMEPAGISAAVGYNIDNDIVPAPKSTQAKLQIRLAQEYAGISEYDLAMQHLHKALEQDKSAAAQVYVGEARIYAKLEKKDLALKNYALAIKNQPKIASLLVERGDYRVKKNQAEEALKDYSAAVKLGPQYSQNWYARAKVERQLHQYDQALADYKMVKKLSPQTDLSADVADVIRDSKGSGTFVR
jgi:tetratricopeptide (TPR) repeat protein